MESNHCLGGLDSGVLSLQSRCMLGESHAGAIVDLTVGGGGALCVERHLRGG